MTRGERINSALLPILEKMREHGATDEMCKMYDNGFHVGAKWADSHPHWISVEGRKPKLKHKYEDTQCSDKVIVTNGEYRTSASWVHNTWAGWFGWFTDGDEELEGVTHWMPMPQAPHHIADVSKKVEKGGEE